MKYEDFEKDILWLNPTPEEEVILHDNGYYYKDWAYDENGNKFEIWKREI